MWLKFIHWSGDVAKFVSLAWRCGCNWCTGQEIWLKLVHWSEDVVKIIRRGEMWLKLIHRIGDVAKFDPHYQSCR
jgi:hypothetical protein